MSTCIYVYIYTGTHRYVGIIIYIYMDNEDYNSGSVHWHRSLVGKASARQAEDLGSNPRVCQIFYLSRCVLSSLLPLRSVERSNFYKGLHNLTTLIRKRHKNNVINEVAILHKQWTVMRKETLLARQYVDKKST